MSVPSSPTSPSIGSPAYSAFGQLVLASSSEQAQHLYAPRTFRDLCRLEEITPELAKLFWQQLLAGDEPDISYQEEILILGNAGDPYYMTSMPVVRGLILFIQESNRLNGAKIRGLQCDGVYFDENAWRCLVQGLDAVPEIKSLHFVGCGLESQSVSFLAHNAPNLRDRLEGLSIDNNDVTPVMAEQLKILLSNFQGLIGLSLNGCGMSDSIFQTVLQGLKDNKTIQELDLSGNHLGDDSMLQLGLHLRELRMLKFLTLKKNLITDRSLILFTPFLEGSSLRELDLSYNSGISNTGAKRVVSEGGLSKINLSHNPNVTSLWLMREAYKTEKIRHLNLASTGISDASVDSFERKLAAFRTFKRHFPAEHEMSVVFNPDERILTLARLTRLQETLPVSVELQVQTKKHERPRERHPAEDVPLYHEIVAAPQATTDFLVRLNAYTHPNAEIEELVKEACFKALLDKQFDIIPIDPDGNCLFASVVECLGHKKAVDHYSANCRDQHMTDMDLRNLTMDYIKTHWADFAGFILGEDLPPQEKVARYCLHKKQAGIWGEDVDVQAIIAVLGEMQIKRPIWIFDRRSVNAVHDGQIRVPSYFTRGEDGLTEEPILLYRMNDNHYSSMFPKEGENKRQGPDGKSEVPDQKRLCKEPGQKSPDAISQGEGGNKRQGLDEEAKVSDPKRVRFREPGKNG